MLKSKEKLKGIRVSKCQSVRVTGAALVALLCVCAQAGFAQSKTSDPAASKIAHEPSAGYEAKGTRNPFIPLISPEGKLMSVWLKDKSSASQGSQELSVEGIIYDKFGLSYAMVNGEVVKVGDSISGYYVLKIENKKIVFIKDNQQKEIILKEEGE
jgi:hypothetical protein